MAKNTASRIQGAKPLMERAEIMEVARGAKKTGNTKCETNILQSRKVGEVGMIDIEKVIEGLLCIKGDCILCASCKYANADGYGRGDRCKRQCASDAIDLLKRQQPEPVRIARFPVGNKLFSHCPRCGLTLDEFIHQPSELRPLYCPICGQAVKWE